MTTYIVNLKSSDAYVYKEITNANNNKQLVFCGALIIVYLCFCLQFQFLL